MDVLISAKGEPSGGEKLYPDENSLRIVLKIDILWFSGGLMFSLLTFLSVSS